ncbi:MAG: HIT family protein [Ignavibacteriae bacterium]|nr:MAG: HIT family protein [Ignavibacteriota bacterium]
MTDCIFCKIISGSIPAEILYENDKALAVLDINPIHYGHALILPKQHCTDFLSLPEESYQSVLQAAKVVTQALVDSLKLEGFNLFSNNGTIAGQSVFHFHLHITPRYRDDDIRFVLNLQKYSDGDLKRYGTMIRKFINPSAL